MKKVGRQVHFIAAEGTNTRNGEGAFIRLKSGKIMFAYTEFIGESREDEEYARISALFSHDEGETWGEKKILFNKPSNAINIMSISLLRMGNGDIGAFFIVKYPDGTDTIVLHRSNDEGETFGEATDCLSCIEKPDYFVMNNDRPLLLESGRIILPLARHTIYDNPDIFAPGVVCFVFSDDDGKTWHKSEQELVCPFPDDENGFQEPGLYDCKDGKILCYIRTGLGFQFKCYSCDEGITWSQPQPDIFLSSPCSPMLIKDFRDATVAIFNPIPEHVLRDDEKEFWGRTPYVMAISTDRGKTFSRENLFYVEDDLNNGYCYPAIYSHDDYFLLAYYHSNNTDCCLNSTKIIKVLYSETR